MSFVVNDDLDGSEHEFDDGTPPEVVKKVLDNYRARVAGRTTTTAKPLPGWGAYPPGTSFASAAPAQTGGAGRYVAGAGQAAVRGLDYGLGLPGDVESLARRGLNALGAGVSPETVVPTSSDWLDMTGRLGISNSPSLIPGRGPYPRAETYGARAVEGATSALPLAALGPASEAPYIVGSATLGGLVGEGAKEAFPGSTLAPVAAGVAAGGLIQGAKSLIAGGTVSRVANALGDSETLTQAGTHLQTQGRDWLNNTMPKLIDAAKAPVDAFMSGAPTPIQQWQQTLRDIQSQGHDLAPVVKLLKPTLPAKLQSAFLNQTVAGSPGGAPASWESVSALRSALGEAINTPSIVNDIGEQNLRRLYGALTEDMRSATLQYGGKGGLADFDNFNQEAERLYGIAQGPLKKVIKSKSEGQESLNPEDAATSLLNGAKRGGSDLSDLRGIVPNAVDELASAHIRMKPQEWNALSPEAKEALVESPYFRKVLDKNTPQSVSMGSLKGHSLPALVGGGLGEHLGTIIKNALIPDSMSDLEAGSIGGTIGLLAPFAGQAAKRVAKQPTLLRLPASGGIGAGNSLFAYPGAQQ